MRDILFRVWDKNLKIMAKVNMIKFNGDYVYPQAYYRYVDPMTERVIDKCSTFGPPDNGGNVIEIMQYTNINDCEGKKIFEGDIVECVAEGTGEIGWYEKWREKFPEWVRFVVKWVDCEEEGTDTNFGQCYNGFSFPPYSDRIVFKIIGNIYENPELVEATH